MPVGSVRINKQKKNKTKEVQSKWKKTEIDGNPISQTAFIETQAKANVCACQCSCVRVCVRVYVCMIEMLEVFRKNEIFDGFSVGQEKLLGKNNQPAAQ